jgi:hypothetical protein
MGALYMGNKPLVKVDSKVSVVFEEFLRLLHALGLPKTDVDLIHSDGPTMGRLCVSLRRARRRSSISLTLSHPAPSPGSQRFSPA